MIEVMISSTISDLRGEREVVKNVLEDKYKDLITLVGADPIQNFTPGSPAYMESKRIAATCDIYFLIIGQRYGHKLEDGRSATELEFDAAFEDDPIKIVPLASSSLKIEDSEQVRFYGRVSDYFKGYWICFYDDQDDLGNKCISMVNRYLEYSVRTRKCLDLLDKFVGVVTTHSSYVKNELSYSKAKEMVEISKTEAGERHILQFSREDISSDFWGCVRFALQI